jgi:hypothetical protein
MGAVVAAVVILGLVIVLTTFVRRRRRTNAPSPSAATTTTTATAAIPTLRVLALGVAQSGKTVFLSSMFHSLHVPAQDRSYFLETDFSQRMALSEVLRQVIDPRQPWPAGTRPGDTREFTFD